MNKGQEDPNERDYDPEDFENEEEDPDKEDDNSEKELQELLKRSEKAKIDSANMTSAMSSIGQGSKDSNFLHLQISTEKMLEKLEHFYRGDVLKDLGQGQVKWIAQKNKDLVTFNEYGVTSLMEVVTKYIDRNTILSNYSEQRIYEIMGDLGEDLVLFILCNYRKIGMDTYFKKTKFRIIITTTLHIIESTYRRAIRGKTLEETNQSRVIGQFGENKQSGYSTPQKKPWVERVIGG